MKPTAVRPGSMSITRTDEQRKAKIELVILASKPVCHCKSRLSTNEIGGSLS